MLKFGYNRIIRPLVMLLRRLRLAEITDNLNYMERRKMELLGKGGNEMEGAAYLTGLQQAGMGQAQMPVKEPEKEPRHIVLRREIMRLQQSVSRMEGLICEIKGSQLERCDPSTDPSTKEPPPSFQEVYDTAPEQMRGIWAKLDELIGEIRAILF